MVLSSKYKGKPLASVSCSIIYREDDRGEGEGMEKKKEFMEGKTQRKKTFMHNIGRILVLNQNCNFSRKVFQNATYFLNLPQ